MTKTILLAWDWEPSVVIGCAALAIGYAVLARFRFRRMSLFYYVGVTILFVALVSPLDTLADEYLFSMHMFQHLLLSAVVPPLLLLGIPLRWWEWLLKRRPLQLAEGFLRYPPIAWFCGISALWFWHWPWLFDAALHSDNLHAFQHLCFLVTGTIFWYPVITPVPGHRMAPFPAVFYLFTACTFSSLLGILITFCSYQIYPYYLHPADDLGILPGLRQMMSAKEDQEVGGLLMWFPCCLVYAAAILIRLGMWYESADESEVPRPGTAGSVAAM